MGVDKLFESEDFLIVSKPYDMYINSDDENEKNTVAYHVALPDSHLSTSADPIHFIQRLDYSTSGVLCIAKNKSAAARGGQLFEKRRSRKYYLAVVRGGVEFELADIDYDVGIDPSTADSSHRMCARTDTTPPQSCARPRRAHTRALALEVGYYDGAECTVLLLKPITGRRHQLRVHCAAAGHLIAGDYTYSAGGDIAPHRMFLHATRLVLPFPEDPIDVQTAEPFHSDAQFASKWKSRQSYHKYRSKEEFITACDIIDKDYVVGVKYKKYTSNDL